MRNLVSPDVGQDQRELDGRQAGEAAINRQGALRTRLTMSTCEIDLCSGSGGALDMQVGTQHALLMR